MNTHIIYSTKANHGQRLAQKIGTALNIPFSPVSERPTLNNIDILFIIGGIYSGNTLPELLPYIKSLTADSVKRAALITCPSGFYDVRLPESRQLLTHKLLVEKNIEVIGEHFCPCGLIPLPFGQPSSKEIERTMKFFKQTLGFSIYD